MEREDLVFMTNNYLKAALWSTCNIENDENDDINFLDQGYNFHNVSDETYEKAMEDCNTFINLAENREINIKDSRLNYGQIGQTFWLMRNGHGCTFDDYIHCPKNIKTVFNEIASSMYHSFYGYVNDDGEVCFE